jgi:hypothetical protein
MTASRMGLGIDPQALPDNFSVESFIACYALIAFQLGECRLDTREVCSKLRHAFASELDTILWGDVNPGDWGELSLPFLSLWPINKELGSQMKLPTSSGFPPALLVLIFAISEFANNLDEEEMKDWPKFFRALTLSQTTLFPQATGHADFEEAESGYGRGKLPPTIEGLRHSRFYDHIADGLPRLIRDALTLSGDVIEKVEAINDHPQA